MSFLLEVSYIISALVHNLTSLGRHYSSAYTRLVCNW